MESWKLGLIKFKNISSVKDFVTWVKRHGKEWENIFANHISIKGLVFIYIKNSQISILKKNLIENDHMLWLNNTSHHLSIIKSITIISLSHLKPGGLIDSQFLF